MDRSTKIIILIVGGVIVIGIILFFVFRPQPGAVPTPAANTNAPRGGLPGTPGATGLPGTEVPTAPTPTPAPELTGIAKDRSIVQNLSTTFAERLGSYSNQGGLTNLNDLETVSTPEVYAYLQGTYRAGIEKKLPPADSYYGVMATVISVNFNDLDESSARVDVQLQNAESGTMTKTTYATLALRFTKQNDTWLVSRLDWK